MFEGFYVEAEGGGDCVYVFAVELGGGEGRRETGN